MSKGKLNLTEKDVVAVYDAEGNELGYKVPKHWGAEQLDPGVTTKKPKSTSASGSSGSSSSAGSSGSSGTGGSAGSGSTPPAGGSASSTTA